MSWPWESGGGFYCSPQSSPSDKFSRMDFPVPVFDNSPNGVEEEEDSGENSLFFDLISVSNSLPKKAFVEMIAATRMSFGCGESFQRDFSAKSREIVGEEIISSVKPLSREILQKETVRLYKEEMATVKEELAKVAGRISLRIGIWADECELNSNYNFICINSRWIDDDWKVKERILEFRAFLPPYYPEDMDQWLSNWHIDRKLLGVSFDDESLQSPELANSLKSCLIYDEPKALFLNIQCCEHLLNSIVQSFLQCIEPMIDKIQCEIGYLLGWGRQKEFYKLAQLSYQVEVTKKLIRDVPGRWNSSYMMLDRALVYKEALLDWGRKDEEFVEFSLRNDEWEKVASLNKFLKVFYDVITSFSRPKYPTSNIYLRGIYRIYCHLLGENQGSDHDFMRGVINDAREKLHKYWLDNSLVLSCAAIFDPRCKAEFVESCYKRLCSDQSMAKEYVNRNLAALHSLFDEYKEKFSYLSSHENALHPSISELDHYLEEQIIDEEIDILEYWKNNARMNRYPVLAMLACDILAIPISVLGSEGCFYTGKKETMLLGRRTYENLQVRICLADWYRAHDPEDGLTRGPELLATEPFQEDKDDYDELELEDEDDYDDEHEQEDEDDYNEEDEHEDDGDEHIAKRHKQ